MDELTVATRQLCKPVGIALLLVESCFATRLVHGGTGVGANDRDMALTINNNDGEVTTLNDVTETFDTATLLSRHHIEEGLNLRAIRDVGLKNTTIDSPLLDRLKSRLGVRTDVIATTDTNSVLSIASLLDTDLLSISARVHLCAIRMLNVNASVLVVDRADIVLTDHHLSIGNSVGLGGTRCGR